MIFNPNTPGSQAIGARHANSQLTTSLAGFHVTDRTGDPLAPVLALRGDAVRFEEGSAFTLSDALQTVTLSGDSLVESRTQLGATRDTSVDQLTFARADGDIIGSLKFRELPIGTARTDAFGPEDSVGEVTSLSSLLAEEAQGARVVFCGNDGIDVVDASSLRGLTEGARLLGRDVEDHLTGTATDDKLLGGRDADMLYGGAGDDVLRGQRGADTLEGGAGNDRLTGGMGADTFVFADTATGRDRITDFDPMRDMLAFGPTVSGLHDLAITDHARGLVVSWNDASSALLLGLSTEDVTEDMFVFA